MSYVAFCAGLVVGGICGLLFMAVIIAGARADEEFERLPENWNPDRQYERR